MTTKEALRILGLAHEVPVDELKKRYHSLMAIAHPDAGRDHNYPYEARDINLAYDFLSANAAAYGPNDGSFYKHNGRTHGKNYTNNASQEAMWKAPLNPGAYADRSIFHNIEDAYGQIIGQTTVASGKYLWTADEDFSLFQRSIYQCGKKLPGLRQAKGFLPG